MRSNKPFSYSFCQNNGALKANFSFAVRSRSCQKRIPLQRRSGLKSGSKTQSIGALHCRKPQTDEALIRSSLRLAMCGSFVSEDFSFLAPAWLSGAVLAQGAPVVPLRKSYKNNHFRRNA